MNTIIFVSYVQLYLFSGGGSGGGVEGERRGQ